MGRPDRSFLVPCRDVSLRAREVQVIAHGDRVWLTMPDGERISFDLRELTHLVGVLVRAAYWLPHPATTPDRPQGGGDCGGATSPTANPRTPCGAAAHQQGHERR